MSVCVFMEGIWVVSGKQVGDKEWGANESGVGTKESGIGVQRGGHGKMGRECA